jgi:hypothetical protein
MAAAAVPEDNSLAYVSSEPETLERYVSLEQGANGKVSRNNTRIDELIGLLEAAEQTLQNINFMPDITGRTNGIVNTLRPMRLDKRNFIMFDRRLLFENFAEINAKLLFIAQEINIKRPENPIELIELPTKVRKLFSADHQQPHTILLNFILLNPSVNGWDNIKNTPLPTSVARNTKLHSKKGITNENIENPNVSDTDIINEYLEECTTHQTAYIKKHNEISVLFEHLKAIIRVIQPILDLIRRLSQVRNVRTGRRPSELPRVKLPKDLLRQLGTLQEDQRKILDKSKEIISSAADASKRATLTTQPSMRGGFLQLGGAAAAAVQHQQQEEKLQLNQNSIIVTRSLLEHLKEGDIIEIVIPNPQNQQAIKFTIKLGRQDRNTQLFVITDPQPTDDQINAFNRLSYQQQLAAMNMMRLGIDSENFLAVAGHLEQMMRNSFIEYDRQLGRMNFVVPEARAAANEKNEPIPFDEAHQPDIQSILYNCYDLQILYLIKHVEVVNLFKFILFYYDILLNNLAILINLLKLFDVLEINIQIILSSVKAKKVIENMKELLENQKKVMSTVASEPVQEGGAGAAARPEIISQLPETIQNEAEIQEYIEQIRNASKDPNLNYKDAKLSSLEKDIADAYIKASKEFSVEKKEKLYKAYKAIRILRLKKLEQVSEAWATVNLKAKARKEIEALKKPESDDLFSAIGRIQTQDDILEGVYNEYAPKKLKQSPFTRAPVDGQDSDLQPILDNYYKLRSAQVCKIGDPNSCSTVEDDINAAKKLIKKVLGNIDNQHFKPLEDKTTLKLFQLADYLYGAYNKETGIFNYNIEWLRANGYENLVDAAERARQREAEEQERARLEEEERARREKARREAAEAERARLEQEAERARLDKEERARLEQEAEQRKRDEEAQRARRDEEAEQRKRDEEAERAKREAEERARLAREQEERARLAREQEAQARLAREAEKRVRREAEEREAIAKRQAIDNLKNSIIPLAQLKLKLLGDRDTVKEEHKSSWATFKKEYKPHNQIITDDNIKEILAILIECSKLSVIREDSINDEQMKSIETIMLRLAKFPDLLAKLNEILFQACRVVVKIRSVNDDDATLKSQQGGYRMNNVINVHSETNKIKLGDLCTNAGLQVDKSYGPFKAVYLPGDNQEYIYKQLFGAAKLDGGESMYKARVDTSQELMEQLKLKKNVVIFGFGFSGSGKTYTLIEGSLNPTDSPDNGKKSLLELFILDNIEQIRTVEFLELYPKEKTTYDGGKTDVYKSITTLRVDANAFVVTLKDRLKKIEEHRYKNLTICATPNNDNSSRSFLMITLKMKTKEGETESGSLVFFDMPGTENTVRIRTQFLGNLFYSEEDKTFKKKYVLCTACEDKKKLNFVKVNVDETNLLKTDSEKKLVISAVANTDDDNVKKREAAIETYYGDESIRKTYPENFSVDKAFKYAITMAVNLSQKFITQNQANQTYIVEMSEAITLFFNGKSEKTFKQFIYNNYTTTKDIYIKLLTPKKILEIVKYFLINFIYKKDEKGNFVYFKLNPIQSAGSGSTSTALTEKDKENIRKIFLRAKTTEDAYISLQHYDYNKLTFYVLDFDSISDSEINFKANKTLFKDVEFDPKFIMIKYFMILLCYVLSKTDGKLSTDEKKDKKTVEYFGLCMVLIFTYKFINFIIEQGESIMTTLEHLKYYFLFNMDRIEDYNARDFDGVKRPFICYEAPIPKYDAEVTADKLQQQKKSAAKRTDENSACGNLLYLSDKVARYTYNTKIGETLLTETVIMGGMIDYGLMRILQKLNGREPDLSKLQVKAGKSASYLDLASITKKDEGAGAAAAAAEAEPGAAKAEATKAMFVMFANIKAQVSKADADKVYNDNMLENIKLICNAEADTLDFAQSVSSTGAEIKPNAGVGTGDGMYTEGGAAAVLPRSGGAIKHYRVKKYLTSRRRKYTLKRLGMAQPNLIYSRRSRKYKS